MVYDVLAALQPVLQRYPGMTIAVWPADRSAEDLTTAVRLSVDPSTGPSLRMPVFPDGDPPAGARDAGSGDPSGGLADDVDRDRTLPGPGVADAEPSDAGAQGPGDSAAEQGADPVGSGATMVGGQAHDVASADHAASSTVVPDVGAADPGTADPGVAGDGDQVVNRPGAEPGESQPAPQPASPRSVAAELARLLRQSEPGSAG
jgi:hypothetical protein